jgi:NAD(P)H-nitrite reductase large subunit
MSLDLAHIGNTPVDITSFNAVAESDAGHEFELKGTDGITGTGVYLTVIGKHADTVSKWITKLVNTSIREQQIAQRKGKQIDPKSLDEIKAQNIEGAILRVTGWRNVTQQFSKELLATVFAKNPHFVDQVIEESDNLGNFTKKQ